MALTPHVGCFNELPDYLQLTYLMIEREQPNWLTVSELAQIRNRSNKTIWQHIDKLCKLALLKRRRTKTQRGNWQIEVTVLC